MAWYEIVEWQSHSMYSMKSSFDVGEKQHQKIQVQIALQINPPTALSMKRRKTATKNKRAIQHEKAIQSELTQRRNSVV
jgi:hypothetical protein